MNPKVKFTLQWVLMAPVAARVISFGSRYCLEFFSAGKLTGYRELLTTFPLGLLLSLLTPWGWLMYGGLIMMINGRRRPGVWCSVGGGAILGLFWPVWATYLN